ncbi:T9SS type A sorting domain-containing protein [Bacteroides salyersiae]|mgnify:FL=1|nr:T9SS type A sorting domain-containing protein [Bacteroides salyersiae]
MLQLSEWQLFVDLSVGIESETAIEAFVDIRVINNRLYIDVPETAQVQVCDLTGMLIHDEKIQSGVSYIPMANLNGGMYIVRIQLSNRTISRKFIK